MTRPLAILLAVAWCFGPQGAFQEAIAQGYGSPLRMQGLDHRTSASAASRGAGGISIGLMSDPSLMFASPTSLQSLQGIHFVLGGARTSRTLDQEQQWLPLRNFPTFSLMMEGLIDQIDDPDLSEPPPEGLGPEDSIPRPYDLIKPNWSLDEPERTSIQGFVAAPFEIAALKVVGGIGAVEYANLDYYFQNNNVLTPSIGTQRPVGVPLPAIGQVIPVDWTQYLQQRRGSIMGYGGAVSVSVTDEISVGASGLLLDGHSDDTELTVGRGRIRFGNNNNVFYHTLDSVYSHISSAGSSDYSGYEVSLGAEYRGPRISLNLTVRAPSVIERTFSGSVAVVLVSSSPVAAAAGRSLARPKSRSFTPLRVIMMLPGLRSRCTMPARCALSRAPAISAP